MGGASRIAAAILPRIEAAGGRVLVGAEVTGIECRDGRAVGVRMADGREFREPMVISDAGLSMTMRLLPPDARGRAALDAVLARVKSSGAHLSLYVGPEQTAEQLGLPKTNYWVYPSHDFEGALARFVNDAEAPLPVAYISFPSAKDPSFTERYPGHATIEVVTMATYEGFARWEGERWHRRGEEYDTLFPVVTGYRAQRMHKVVS